MCSVVALFDNGWCHAKIDSKQRETTVIYLEWDIIFFFLQAASGNPFSYAF